MRKFRLTMLGLLCGGLLCVGLGLGVGFAEFSSFTYIGERLPEASDAQTARLTVPLDADADAVYFSSHLIERDLGGELRLFTSDAVAPGALYLEVEYLSAGPGLSAWGNRYEDEEDGTVTEEIHLSWSDYNELTLVLACKDQVLADLKAHQLGEYVPLRITGATATVHPDDAARVQIVH